MLKRIRIVRVRPWGVCKGVISTVGVLYQIVGYTVDDSHHIRIDIQFHDDKTLFLETGEKEGKVKKKDGK